MLYGQGSPPSISGGPAPIGPPQWTSLIPPCVLRGQGDRESEVIAIRTAEEIGQQLLLLAYMPAIHKVHREVCQKFPGLCPEDIAQQATVCFLETVRTPEMHIFNGHLSAALARRFRQSLFRWAIGEIRQSLPLQAIADSRNQSEQFRRRRGVGTLSVEVAARGHPLGERVRTRSQVPLRRIPAGGTAAG